MSAIHYLVRVKLIRVINNEKIDFIYDEKIFIEQNPILAREKAFSHYNSYIDIILEPNLEHSKIAQRISKRIEKKIIEIDNEKIEINDFQSGIGIFLIIDEPINEDNKGDEFLIHGIGFSFSDPQSLIDNLNFENWYYEHYKYDTKDYRINIDFYEADVNEIGIETILKTPFNWETLNLSTENVNNDVKNNESITDEERIDVFFKMIKEGEGNQVEFKSSLVSYLNTYGEIGYSKHIKFKIIKTIASFLNSNGGFLFIGVKDDMSILGLENDFSLANSKLDNPKDYFRLEVDKIIKEHFKVSATNISGEFIKLNEKHIYIMTIEPSLTPVFIFNRTNKDIAMHKKEFYVRLTGASSVLYSEIDDIVEYCLNHWNKK